MSGGFISTFGYIYWKQGKYERAAETYVNGSQINGAPPFMRMMSARMKTEGGSRDVAREMYKQILDEADDENSRAKPQRFACCRSIHLDGT